MHKVHVESRLTSKFKIPGLEYRVRVKVLTYAVPDELCSIEKPSQNREHVL